MSRALSSVGDELFPVSGAQRIAAEAEEAAQAVEDAKRAIEKASKELALLVQESEARCGKAVTNVIENARQKDVSILSLVGLITGLVYLGTADRF